MNRKNKRQWLKKRNLKRLKLRTKKKANKKLLKTKQHKYNYNMKKKYIEQNKDIVIDKEKSETIKPFDAPKNFSLIENSDETILYFDKILSYMSNSLNKKNILYFNIHNIENITNESLMYLLAIIKNVKMKFSVRGNLPKDKDCKKIMISSGFMEYVNTKDNVEIEYTKDKLRIKMGNDIGIYVAKEIIDFLIMNLGIPKNKWSFLYDILIELMANTKQHAYRDARIKTNNSNILQPYWYIFVELKEHLINFSFLDTGEGIPQTIKKKWTEKINLLGIKTDSNYIQSTLKGEFRSKTGKEYRGKGLPKIQKYVEDNKIQNLTIISSFGTNKTDVNNNLVDLKNKLQGTLFYWEIDVNKLKEEQNENNNC